VRLLPSPSALPPEGYRLEVHADHITLEASDPAGFGWGLVTLERVLAAGEASGKIDGACIEDAPAFARRGCMLDISRDRIPKLEPLLARIDLLARLKVNHLELYMEHSFAYAGHEVVHAGLSPITPSELRAIVDHAAARGIQVVPNQNTFGHMHRWLRHPEYAHLAEDPTGSFHAFDYRREPFSLCPTDPGSLALVADLLGQLLPLVPGTIFNGGLDETFDVGQGRSKAQAQADGLGAVYGTYLQQVAQLARAHGKRLAFWADILLEHPKSARFVPSDGIAILWGYEAGHPFEQQAARLADMGVEWWIAPGTSTWQSLTGRWHNACANLDQAIAAGRAHGAAGLLLTDWGDYGHWQPPSLSEPAIVRAMARAWNPAAPLPDEADFVNTWRFDGAAPELARAWREVQTCAEWLQDGARNGTGPFYALRYPPHAPNRKEDWRVRAPGYTLAGSARYREHLAGVLERVQGTAAGWDWELAELAWCCHAGQFAAEWADQRLSGRAPGGDLLARSQQLETRMRELWLQRSRPGGLEDACRKWRHAWSVEDASKASAPESQGL